MKPHPSFEEQLRTRTDVIERVITSSSGQEKVRNRADILVVCCTVTSDPSLSSLLAPPAPLRLFLHRFSFYCGNVLILG